MYWNNTPVLFLTAGKTSDHVRWAATSRSRTPPAHLIPSAFDCDIDFPEAIGAPKGKTRGRSQKDKAPSKSSKGKGKDTPLRPVLLRLHDLRARVQAKLSNTILRPLVISCATRAFHLGTSADRRGTKLQEATLMVSMFSFLVQCCAHHHDSGSLCNLCLRSEIQEWREMGPAEESKNENNNTTNPPQHHKTEPTYWTT